MASIHELPLVLSKLVLVAYQDYLISLSAILVSRIPHSVRSAPLFLALANQGLEYRLYACLLIYAMIC